MRAHEVKHSLPVAESKENLGAPAVVAATNESKEDLSTSVFLTSVLDEDGCVLQEVAPINKEPCATYAYANPLNLKDQISYYFEAECKLSEVYKLPTQTTIFDGISIPSIRIRNYLDQIENMFSGSLVNTLIGTFILVRECTQLKKPRYRLTLTPFNIHRIVLTSALIVTKFYAEHHSSVLASDFAHYGGIKTFEMRTLEHELIERLEWDLSCLSEASFQKAFQLLAIDGVHTIPIIKEVLPKEYKFNNPHPDDGTEKDNRDLVRWCSLFKEVKDQSYNPKIVIDLPLSANEQLRTVLSGIPKKAPDNRPWTPDKAFNSSIVL